MSDLELTTTTIPALDGALCSGAANPEAWFPFPSEDRSEVVSICNACPVKSACLDWAVENKEDGVWGGQLLKRGKVVNTPVTGSEASFV